MDNSPANVQILRDAVSMHHCHESDHTPVEKPLPDQKNNPYTAKAGGTILKSACIWKKLQSSSNAIRVAFDFPSAEYPAI